VVFSGRPEPIATPVYRRPQLPTGMPIAGPAIVEQADTTTVIEPGQTAVLDAAQNLVVTLGGSARP
jgi:N-methylhydantoinase A